MGMKLDVGIKNLPKHTTLGSIEVPEELKNRRKSGLDWLDQVVGGGGFVPSSVSMFTGTPGAGKTTAFLQAAEAASSNPEHVVIYNTGEESVFQTAMVRDRLGIKGNFFIQQYTMMQELLHHMDSLKAANPGKTVWVFQDSLQTLDDGKWKDGTNPMTAVRCAAQLVEWNKKNYGIVIFIGQVKKDGKFAGKNTILHSIDCQIALNIDEKKKSETYGERLLTVTKNRYGANGITLVMGMENKGLIVKGSIGEYIEEHAKEEDDE